MAKWYDFDYERRMRKDLFFYLDCARQGGDPVLELGVGTGRVALRLARAGFHVTGVDISQQMLAQARRRLERQRDLTGSVRLVQGDMANLRVRGRFRTVLVPFRAFHHLYTIERQLAALRAIRGRLRDDGIAVIDLLHPDLSEFKSTQGKLHVSYERKHPRRGTRIVQRFRLSCDWPHQMLYIDYIWDEYRGRRRLSRDHAPMRWRWFHRYEFEHLLARSRLRVVRVLGGFDRRPYDTSAEEMIFLAARA
jgi:ubiquinone/menaquinone biosynthesis C-methylase UbiE